MKWSKIIKLTGISPKYVMGLYYCYYRNPNTKVNTELECDVKEQADNDRLFKDKPNPGEAIKTVYELILNGTYGF